MANYSTLNALFTAIANAIRGKTGSTGKIVADDFPSAIAALDTSGITPTGTKTITENGTFDVTNFASAVVNVATSPASENVVVRTVTLNADVTNTDWRGETIISADPFIKANYSDSRFFAILSTESPISTGTGVIHWIYHGNRNIGATSPAWYAMVILGTSASALGFATQTTKINGEGYNISLRVNSSGDLIVYAASNRIVKAGTYKIVLGLLDY